MNTYLKITLSMMAIIAIQLYGVICQHYGFTSVLNPTWFQISWWIMLVQAIICGILFFPCVFSENGEDEIKSVLKDFGMEPLSKIVYCWPFFIFVVTFIQYGSLWPAILTIPVLLLHWGICYTHNDCLTKFLSAEAQKGTNHS